MAAPQDENREDVEDVHDERDERIRLLEYQSEFLRRELTLVTRRYEAIIYSAAWTVARPLKRFEDAMHTLARRMRGRRKRTAGATAPLPANVPRQAAAMLEDKIAARIAAKVKRPTVQG